MVMLSEVAILEFDALTPRAARRCSPCRLVGGIGGAAAQKEGAYLCYEVIS